MPGTFSGRNGASAVSRNRNPRQRTNRAEANAIQAVKPSDIFSCPGPDVHLTGESGRTGIEDNWFVLTGRVVAVKAETDGDIHIALQDATGDKPGIVIVEAPEKPQWCSIRQPCFQATAPAVEQRPAPLNWEWS